MTVLLVAVATALGVSFFCSIFEAVLLSVGHARVVALKREGARSGVVLDRFKRAMDTPIAAILILNTFAHTVGAAVAGAKYVEVFERSTFWIFSLVFTLAVLVFTEIIPKTLGFTFRDVLAAPVALSVNALVVVLKPIIAVTQAFTRLLCPADEPPVTSEDEIRLLASLGRAEGVVQPRLASIIEAAAALREQTAADTLMPRNHVTFLSRELSLEENLQRVHDSGHSRFPLVPGQELDQIEGVVLAKELLFHARNDGEPVDWGVILRPPLFVPGAASLQQMLRLFQDESRHLAIVVDEYGGVDGIVTLEDVLEELVGEIWDESDRRQSGILERPDGRLICRGLVEMRTLLERIDVEIPTETVTLSGFLGETLGAVPRNGDVVETAGYRFRVLRASPRRAEQIEIRKI